MASLSPALFNEMMRTHGIVLPESSQSPTKEATNEDAIKTDQVTDEDAVTTDCMNQLPAEVLALSLSYLWTEDLISTSSTCKSLSTFILQNPTNDRLLFQRILLLTHPSFVLSAIEKDASLTYLSYLDILKAGSLQSLEWLESETSDRVRLKKPSQSRSVYVIRIEAGGKRFVRMGGHYFFKIGFCSFDGYELDRKTGRIHNSGKWITPRIHGFGPSPLRGFTFNSLSWSLPSLAKPVTIIFGGAETSYPFDETQEIWIVVPLMLRGKAAAAAAAAAAATSKSSAGSADSADSMIRWMWMRGNASGTPPSPRRGCSATAITDDRQIVFVGGSRTSPCTNFNDIHVLDMRGSGLEKRLHSMSWIDDMENLPKEMDGMNWSTIELAGCTFPGRSSHVAFQLQSLNIGQRYNVSPAEINNKEKKKDEKRTATILIYGGFQMGGKTTMVDVHSLSVADLQNDLEEEKEEEEEEEKEKEKEEEEEEEKEEEKEEKEEESSSNETSREGFKVKKCTWSVVEPDGCLPSTDRTGPAMHVIGRKMILVGGHSKQRWNSTDADDSQLPVDVLVFNPSTMRWYSPRNISTSTVPPTRCGAGLSMVGPVLLMSGGYEATKSNPRSTLLKKENSMRMRFGS